MLGSLETRTGTRSEEFLSPAPTSRGLGDLSTLVVDELVKQLADLLKVQAQALIDPGHISTYVLTCFNL